MNQPLQERVTSEDVAVEETIMRLAREASIEINVQDLKDLAASRPLLAPGKKIFVTFLPKQTWEATETACRTLKNAGFEPVPHIPVRLIKDAQRLDTILGGLVQHGQVREVLLLSGDYPHPEGPYASVEDVLNTDALSKFGLKRVCFAGHPEGHPNVQQEEIRRAERAKALSATGSGMEVTLVTQFFFEADPFLHWTHDLRAAGVTARIVGSLVGPTKLSTLFKYALRCGAGPSIRALGARPSAFTKLLGDHGPENVLRRLAHAIATGAADFDGIHLFCFGGYLRTCEWLHRVAEGQFTLNASGGFNINSLRAS